MIEFLRHATAITVATFDLAAEPKPPSPRTFGDTLLAGIGLVTHSFDEDGQFRIKACTSTLETWSAYAPMLNWLEGRLVAGQPLIGYDLNNRIVPLLAAKAILPQFPTIAALPTAINVRSCDLAERDAVGTLVPFAVVCARESIPLTVWNWDIAKSGWTPSVTGALGWHLVLQALATWRLWAGRQPSIWGQIGLREHVLADIDIWLARATGSGSATIN